MGCSLALQATELTTLSQCWWRRALADRHPGDRGHRAKTIGARNMIGCWHAYNIVPPCGRGKVDTEHE